MSLDELKKTAIDFAKSGNWSEEAVQVNNQIIELDPECAGAYTRLAKIYFDNGDHHAAMHMYEMVIKLDPTNRIAKNGFNRTKKSIGNPKVQELVAQVKSFEQIFSLARKFKYVGDLSACVAAYRRALEIASDPQDLQVARTGLASALTHSGVDYEAEKLYRQSLQVRPSDNVAKIGLAAVLSKLSKYKEAEKLCREVLSEEPHNDLQRNVCLEFTVTKGEAI